MEVEKTEIKDLPEDIVFNILLRLSAQTIHNLRYVFNFWSSIITSSCFHDAHFRGSKHGLLLSRKKDEEIKSKKRKQQQPLFDTNIINTNNKEELITMREFTAASGDILATCNGLVLFGDEKGETELFVANPATKDLLKLPAHKSGSSSCLDHIFGMTYIESVREYKVIHCFIDLVNRSTKNNYCEILTLGCDSWKRVDKFPVRLLQWSSRKFTFINDVAHCLALEDGCEGCLVSFDMIHEKFHTTIVPVRLSKIDELLEIEGFPALVSHNKSKKANGCRFWIWLLKDYYKGNWVRLRKIGLGGRNEHVSSVTTSQHGTRIIFLQYDGTSKYYSYIGYDVQLNQKRYLNFRQKIPSASMLPHSESLLSCSNFIAEPYTETCKRRKLH